MFSYRKVHLLCWGVRFRQRCCWRDLWDVTPFQPIHISRRFDCSYCLHLRGQSSHHFLLTLKAVRSFETLVFTSRNDVTFQHTLRQHCCGKLKSLKTFALRIRTFSLFRTDSLTFIEHCSLKLNFFFRISDEEVAMGRVNSDPPTYAWSPYVVPHLRRLPSDTDH